MAQTINQTNQKTYLLRDSRAPVPSRPVPSRPLEREVREAAGSPDAEDSRDATTQSAAVSEGQLYPSGGSGGTAPWEVEVF